MESTADRMTRFVFGMRGMAIAMVTLSSEGLSMVTIAMASTSGGIVDIMSAVRWMAWSTRPPKKPLHRPASPGRGARSLSRLGRPDRSPNSLQQPRNELDQPSRAESAGYHRPDQCDSRIRVLAHPEGSDDVGFATNSAVAQVDRPSSKRQSGPGLR